MRKPGRKNRQTGEIYGWKCYYRDHPYRADDYAYWHRDPEKPMEHPDPKKPEDWRTFI